ncbi:TonB-dependent receptor [Sphingomonas morindae]|uniref:TonB-dependent receptor n=1 Tax=Sphingomonas morindae TaxID=1541170 RepID=A0ABY4XE73_9SPHN|nr:TonB-dependent receptor [Sphingomonas morindae]USI75005.1 TonB-dependent receptor [Sphingomonas morindae]
MRFPSMSARVRLAVRVSSVALCGAGSLFAAAASAQTTPDAAPQPGASAAGVTADPTAEAAARANQVSTEPVPSPDGQTPVQPAGAQANGGGDIVVTGIRASLASAARIKRNSTLIVDSISAEDIGKLPDVSIADSLARLPGVAAQRVEGRDQNLSIRGLGPDFSTTLLNGREQVTVGDNRGVEFDQYPSEFFQNVNVYKTADASLIAPGIAGTVDLRMLRPLAQSKRVLVVSARGEMNQLKALNPDSSRYGYRASATYVDKFAGDTLGVALGASLTRTPTQNERYNSWGYPTDAAGDLILGGAKPYVESATLNRYGVVGTLEWQPSDRFHSTFDALYSHFTDTRRLRGIEFPLAYSNPTLVSATASNGIVDQATFTNVYGVQRNDYQKRRANSFSLGWNNQFSFTDTLHLNVDASWSHAKRTDYLLESYTGTGFAKSGIPDTLTITRQNNGIYNIATTLNYADPTLFRSTDPQGWGFAADQGAIVQAGYYNRPSFKDDLKALRGTLTGDIQGSVLKSWEIGGNYSRREKTNDFTSYFLCPQGGGATCAVRDQTPTSAAIPASALLKNTVSLGYLGIPQMLTYDPTDLVGSFYKQARNLNPGEFGRRFTITENVWTGYAKLNIDGEVGGKAVKGSLGVQAVHTQQSSTGVQAGLDPVTAGLTLATIQGKHSYWNVMPSASFSVELLEATYVKLGASQTMVRPRMDQEKITQTFSINTSNVGRGNPALFPVFSATGGNLNLEPYQSTNIDVSLEKYFPGGGYVALSGYFKKLSDYVDPNNSLAFDYSRFVSLLPAAQQALLAPGEEIGFATAPANTGKGYLQGLEGTVSLPFKMLSHYLDGFGVFATGTITDSAIRYSSNPTVNLTVPGLSKYVYSLTAFYEKNGFQARLNYRYRSKFLAEIQGLSADPTQVQAKAEAILDAQIGYDFREGPLKGLSVLLQGKNLTDRPFVTYYNNDPRQIRDYQRYGRDFFVGVTYKF